LSPPIILGWGLMSLVILIIFSGSFLYDGAAIGIIIGFP
jgi:hypothetical protein